jgi:hypothetical protein
MNKCLQKRVTKELRFMSLTVFFYRSLLLSLFPAVLKITDSPPCHLHVGIPNDLISATLETGFCYL